MSARCRPGKRPLVEQAVRSTIRRHIAALDDAWASGQLAADSPLRDVSEAFRGVQYAPWYPGGSWSGDRASWIAGTAAGAAGAGPGHRWEVGPISVVARSDDEAMASYSVRLHWPDAARPVATAFFLETWRRDGARWLLARHTAEKASAPDGQG